ncbi:MULTISPECIES: hypothetical protein [unclassified Chelatococcus]|uniref:hypothetical protein n=1 Tax=unclassified Chelatococcus TaxID=2638111 RepID=UPI001BCBC3BF|nr:MULTISPECIES: hypothetical protein [unclassified Chelatococcus]MBS7737800.1 hypothetical protein [Chelatococcus sp. HY11]MCO5079256.1 hypothetical protein [Chelatococcus sp.]CAH1665961.1 hypothetical protein CHELA41_22751 [Hyphomicrobiales bacterium]CAH1680992.1 hypothetical protein CHELA20_52169 [Hyphomicrobiales bacterium]
MTISTDVQGTASALAALDLANKALTDVAALLARATAENNRAAANGVATDAKIAVLADAQRAVDAAMSELSLLRNDVTAKAQAVATAQAAVAVAKATVDSTAEALEILAGQVEEDAAAAQNAATNAESLIVSAPVVRIVIPDTSYTLLAENIGKYHDFTAATAITVTLPANMPEGWHCGWAQLGAGRITFAGAHNALEMTKSAAKDAQGFLRVRDNAGGNAAYWLLSGEVAE